MIRQMHPGTASDLLEHTRILLRTRVPLPVKVIVRVAPAVSSRVCIALRAVLERLVSISDIVEEVDLLLLGEKRSANGVHRRISPSLVVEPSGLFKVVEEVRIGLRAPESQVS